MISVFANSQLTIHQIVQAQQGIRPIHGIVGGFRMGFLKFVYIRPGQQNDQRPVRVVVRKRANRIRRPPRMQGHHHVSVGANAFFGDDHIMPQFAQYTRPANGGGPVSGAGLFPCGGDKANLHSTQPSEEL